MSSVEPVTPKDAFVVTPHDTNALAKKADALFAGVAGDIALVTLGGTSLTFTVGAGSILPLQVTKVLSTGTTATGIRGLIY